MNLTTRVNENKEKAEKEIGKIYTQKVRTMQKEIINLIA